MSEAAIYAKSTLFVTLCQWKRPQFFSKELTFGSTRRTKTGVVVRCCLLCGIIMLFLSANGMNIWHAKVLFKSVFWCECVGSSTFPRCTQLFAEEVSNKLAFLVSKKTWKFLKLKAHKLGKSVDITVNEEINNEVVATESLRSLRLKLHR